MTLALGLESSVINSRFFTSLHPLIRSILLEVVLFVSRGYGLGISKTIPSPNPIAESVITNIKSSKIRICPSINKFTSNGCMFINGTTTEYDLIICCTGFKKIYPFLDKDFHPTTARVFSKKDERIAFVGGKIEVMEMQARWVASAFSGICRIPQSFYDSGLDAVTYMDMIAKELKVKPKIWWLALTNWSGLFDTMFGVDFLKQYGRTKGSLKKMFDNPDILKSSPVAAN